MIRLGPFHVMYTRREQKIRDLIKHMVAKHGIIKARALVNEEYMLTATVNPSGEPAIYWNDVRWAMKQLVHSLNYGREVGL